MIGVPSIIGFIVVSILEVILNLLLVIKMLGFLLVHIQIVNIFCADSGNRFGSYLDRKIWKTDIIDG